MFRDLPFWIPRRKRGDIRLIVLEVLSRKPMHGYEVAKEVAKMFGGLYEPSPGVVYPTLQWLEDMDFVSYDMVDGKRVYRVTEKGMTYLEERRDYVKRLMEEFDYSMRSERARLLLAGRRLAQAVFMILSEGDEEKFRKATEILEDARKQVLEMVLR